MLILIKHFFTDKEIQMKRDRLRALLLISLFASVISVCSVISIPFTVPLTMGTLGIFAALGTLGGVRGTGAILLYIAIGAIGLPVYAGFSGGIGHLLGPSGGFILGYAVCGLVYILLEGLIKKNERIRLAVFLLCQVVIYICGAVWFAFVFGSEGSFLGALTVTCLPFILPDMAKIFLASYISKRLNKLF